MNEENQNSPYEIFEGTAWEAGLLQSILADNEIESILRDTQVLPWNVLPIRSGSARLFVGLKDLDKAKVLTDEFMKNLQKPDEPFESQ